LNTSNRLPFAYTVSYPFFERFSLYPAFPDAPQLRRHCHHETPK
jgi:hypothetical protein